MRLTNKTAIAAALALNVAEVWAATALYCPEAEVCFRWGVPEAAAKSGSGNVYFQLRAPANYSWIGLGTGSKMQGSDMFVMYANGMNNVTLSTRSGTGHTMPQHVERNDVQLVEGSGISNGQMVANIQCNGCSKLDLSGSSGWIAAWAQGSPLNSNSLTQRISKHDGFDSFSVDLSKATVKSDQNPFAGPAAATSGGDMDAVSGGNRGSSGKSLGNIHGILMAVVFLIGYPLGSTLMPLVGNWILHASWQMLVFVGMWAGFGIGYVISRREGYLGVILCALLGLQPAFGSLHHLYFVKHRERGVISHVHIWYGRGLMLLGIINGGLGLKLGGSSRGFVTAYSVIAVIVSLMYIGSILFRMSRSKQRRFNGGPKFRVNSI
ncbi:cytochrome domain of cellobiose dehydrogenase [Hirsutella rhossiliensis]|uniref:Cytochrome domain of cellobiose dehydrogenase n=1 Tax=Hirsutella rhossiliensis TaxID=111463 RepID=A0A9P8N015_9HYPO|nr:cytochrome domain of cellobiose dehydrogenase [Hirsutella rhossiliensis]KAH0963416.1 cytochrome domain of cellobiose dehydrogenase [Hirsutella rhossiliensis]